MDKDGCLNRGELEAFIQATRPEIATHPQVLRRVRVDDFFILYQEYIDGEKGLTFDGFLLSFHQVVFDLDKAFKQMRLVILIGT